MNVQNIMVMHKLWNLACMLQQLQLRAWRVSFKYDLCDICANMKYRNHAHVAGSHMIGCSMQVPLSDPAGVLYHVVLYSCSSRKSHGQLEGSSIWVQQLTFFCL
jgi:hypothetical protein